MNTKFNYMYRDAGNWKSFYSVVFEGEISDAQLKHFAEITEGNEYFIPRAIGLSGGVLADEDGYDVELDHYWCEHDFEDSFEIVTDEPSVFWVEGKPVTVTIDDFLHAFELCNGRWEVALDYPISMYSENATYISYWENGAIIEFPCKVNLNTKEVYSVEFDSDTLDCFDIFLGEKVRLKNGLEYELSSKSDISLNSDSFWHKDSSDVVVESRVVETTKENIKDNSTSKPKYREMLKILNDNGILLMQPLIADCVDALLPIGMPISDEEYEQLCEKCFDAYLEHGEDDVDIWEVVKDTIFEEIGEPDVATWDTLSNDNTKPFVEQPLLDSVIASCEEVSKNDDGNRIKSNKVEKGLNYHDY